VNRRWAEAALAVNTVVWGATFVLVKAALSDISPLLFLALRFSLAAVILIVIFRKNIGLSVIEAHPEGTPPAPSKSPWPAFAAGALAGSFLFAGYAFQTAGLKFTTPAKSAFLTGLTSVLVPFVVALVYKIRPQVSELLGVLVATAGLGLMTLNGVVAAVNPGDLLTICCAVAFAAHIVTLGHFSEQMSFEILSVSQIATAAVWASSLFWWAEKPHVEWRPAVVYGIIVTGFLATALAFTIQAWAQQYTTSTRTALIYMLEPVVAWMTSYVMVGEGLSRRAAVGAALILGGVLLVEMKPLNSRQHPSN
jgi:drug/metabolite transporter (DMT)-like permease